MNRRPRASTARKDPISPGAGHDHLCVVLNQQAEPLHREAPEVGGISMDGEKHARRVGDDASRLEHPKALGHCSEGIAFNVLEDLVGDDEVELCVAIREIQHVHLGIVAFGDVGFAETKHGAHVRRVTDGERPGALGRFEIDVRQPLIHHIARDVRPHSTANRRPDGPSDPNLPRSPSATPTLLRHPTGAIQGRPDALPAGPTPQTPDGPAEGGAVRVVQVISRR